MSYYKRMMVWFRAHWWVVILIVAVGMYLPALRNGFVWDDEEQVVNNQFIREWRNLPQLFTGSTFGGGGTASLTGGYYKPLLSVWFLINYKLWGLYPWGWHLTQSVLHGINGVLVYYLLLSVLKKHQRWLAGLGALIWVVHPVQVESVAYISAVQELLMTALSLAAILLAIKGKLKVSLGLWGLALLAKESAVVVPVIVAAYIWMVEKKINRVVDYSMGCLLILGGYALLRFGVAGVGLKPHEIIPITAAPLWQRLLTVPESLYQLVRVIFWPVYLYIGHHQVVTGVIWRWVGELLLLLSLITRLRGWFGWWVAVSVVLISNLFPLDMTFAERWAYFPLIGIIGLVMVGISQWPKRWVIMMGGVLILALGTRSVVRMKDWQNGLTLYNHDIALAPPAFDLENNLGVELARVNQWDEAKIHFERSIVLQPEWWTNYSNLGAYFQRRGQLEIAKTLYLEAIKNGDYYLAYENLAGIYWQQKDKELEPFLTGALAKFPYNRQLQAIYAATKK